MASMLKATLIGFLAGNPEKIEYDNGTSVCAFTVAVNKKERNKDGELIDNVVWVNVKAWGKNAENLMKFATKGTQIYIEGTPYASAYMSKKSAGVAVAVIVPVVCVPIYQSATKLLASWDGENEEMSDTIDEKLSIVLWVTSAAFILSYFLIAASYANGFETFKTETSGALFLAGIIGFLTIMIEAVIFQQKCVDTTKKMNPEKTASVYDTKFQKKWMESCDEAEKIMIGKCAFKAYAATNTVCSILSIVLAICALVFGIGFLPSLVVCLIWIVNQSVYCKEALKYSKAGNKIS